MTLLKNKFNLLKTLLLISGFLLLSWYNSASAALITVSGTISANTTWDAANTYQVTSSITLSAGYTLTIPAGTVVKFNPSISMIVYGNLQAVGTPGNEIYFTSRDDDTVGAIATSSDHNPVRWDWDRITMTVWSDSSVLENVIIKYPQIWIHTYNVATAFTLRNSTVTGSVQMGIYSYNNGASTISGNTISNGLAIWIYVNWSGNQLITNNTIMNNLTGMMISTSNIKTITNNAITNNTGKWLDCYSETVNFNGNNFSGNAKPSRFCTIEPLLTENPTNTTYNDINSFFEVNSIKMPLISTGNLPKLSWPVVLYGGTLDSGKTLIIAPGNIFRMYIWTTAAIDIAGNLQAIGTVSEPIVFTSKNDNTAGGVLTWSTISTSSPAKWDWGKINMTTWSDSSVLENVIIKYPQIWIHTYNVATAFTLRNSTISETVQMGIYSYNNGASTISGNTISNGLAIWIYVNWSGNQLITNNTIMNNLTGINIGSITNKTVTNNTIVNNTWVWIYITNTTATIKNNISYGNNFGIQCTSTMTITYNLFYNNTSGTQNGTNCTIWVATNKTTSDPLFVDYANKNYRLQATSPAINAGDPSMWYHPLSGDFYDIWAYEYYIAGITRESTATISNPDGRTLDYTWSFSGWVAPVFIGAYTGTTSDTSKTVSCNYTIKYKWDYRLKLSLFESGSLVKESDYGLTVQ